MLVLGRKVGESLVLDTSDGRITITVVYRDDQHGKMRLGIDAPLSVSIKRSELLERPKQAK